MRRGRARPSEHDLQTDEVALHYGECGDDELQPLVALHGLAARWQVFAPVLPSLCQDWHVFAPDLRGHGMSGRAPRYAVDDFAGDIVHLLSQRVGAPAVLYGHSLGGWVALSVAARHPGLVRALVIADAAIYAHDIDPDLAVSYLSNLPLTLRSLAKSLQQLDPHVMEQFRAGQMVAGYDAETLLARVTCPVLLLQGDGDRGALMRDDDVERALAALPDARHARFDGIGHGLHVEDARAVLEVVVPFLEELEGA